MGKDIAICYFSGTGNTAAVARMLHDELQPGNAVTLIRIDDVRRGRAEFNPSRYDLIGVGFPSYGFNAPAIVTDFVKRLSEGRADAFLFTTCAGPCYINDIAGHGLKRLLTKRGYTVVHEKAFCMPANVLLHYSDELVRQLVGAARRRARAMAADIASGKRCARKDGVGAMLVRALYVWCERPMMRILALDYRVKKDCNRCMTCVNNCPMGNIAVKGGKIRFGAHCAACYRCVYGCPRRAIAARLTNAAILKEGYNIGRFLRDGAADGNYVTKDTKGLYSTLYKYFQES